MGNLKNSNLIKNSKRNQKINSHPLTKKLPHHFTKEKKHSKKHSKGKTFLYENDPFYDNKIPLKLLNGGIEKSSKSLNLKHFSPLYSQKLTSNHKSSNSGHQISTMLLGNHTRELNKPQSS